MLERMFVIANRLDKLIKLEDKWYNSKTRMGWAVKVLVAFCSLLLAVTVMFTIFSLVLHYLPWLAACIILVCVTMPLVVIIPSFILKRINAGLWVTAMISSVLLFIFSFWVWFSEVQACNMQFVRVRLFSSKTQFPLGDIGGIAVDGKGRIYLTVQRYNRIQVYSNKGDFLQGWFIGLGGGDFNIWLEDDNQIHTISERTSTHKIFDLNGQIVKSTKIRSDQEYMALHQKAGGLKEQDAYGNSYSILSPKWFPKVVKLTPEGEQFVLIQDPLYLWLVKMPQPLWLIIALGGTMALILGKIIKKKVNFPKIDAIISVPTENSIHGKLGKIGREN